MKFVVTIMSALPPKKVEDGINLIGGAVVGPFDTREETLEFIRWLENEHPDVAIKTTVGSAQLLEAEAFKQAVNDTLEKKRLRESGRLHS